MTHAEIVKHLRTGVQSDIWYDADNYGDAKGLSMIRDVMAAMQEAADILDVADEGDEDD